MVYNPYQSGLGSLTILQMSLKRQHFLGLTLRVRSIDPIPE